MLELIRASAGRYIVTIQYELNDEYVREFIESADDDGLIEAINNFNPTPIAAFVESPASAAVVRDLITGREEAPPAEFKVALRYGDAPAEAARPQGRDASFDRRII